MKKIILSSSLIVAVAVAVIGATTAFYNDTETSTGNVFASGAIDLLVDSESHYDGLVCTGNPGVWEEDTNPETDTTRPELVGKPCGGTWAETNLGPTGFAFFNFSDIKPGDYGENTISLHIVNNDAYMCAIIDNMEDVEIAPSCTEPEAEDLDTTCTLGTPQDGELADELHFFAWLDQGATPGFGPVPTAPDQGEGDNIWQGPTAEPNLFSNVEGPASDVLDGVSYELFAPGINGGAVMQASSTYYIGLYWCYGTIGGLPNGPLTCDGEPVDNQSQTDQLTADITFYAEQSRNNPNFTCPGLTPPPVQEGAITVDKEVTFSSVTVDVDVNDFTLHISDGDTIDQDVTDEVEVANLPPGTYTVSEIYTGLENITFDAQFSGACTDDGDTGTVTLVGGDDVTCTITNVVSPQ